MPVVYRVKMMCSERGWGSEHWHEDYPTLAQAKWRIRTVNSKNTAPRAPDYYEVADEIVEALEL